MKKFLSLLFSLLIAAAVIPTGISAFAEGKPQEVKPLTEREVFYTAESQARMSLASASQTKAFENIIYNAAIKSNTDALNLDSLEIKITEVNGMIQAVIDKYPELYNIKRWAYNYYKTTNNVHELSLRYDYTADEYAAMNTAYKKIADSMLSDIKGNTALTDKEKLLILHDRIAVWCEYDEEGFNKYTETGNINLVDKNSFTMYGTLVNRLSVCQGYSKTYQYLLNQLGIENYLCSSEKLVHVWNIVKLDGVYYHVDVTYDDPTHDVLGRADHSNFLVSTAKLKENEHNETDFDTTPSDTRYDNAFWTDSQAAFQLVRNRIFYTDGSRIYEWDDDTDKNDSVLVNSNIDRYTRLASDSKNIYFSGNDGNIYAFDTQLLTQNVDIVVTAPLNAGEFLYGFRFDTAKYNFDLASVQNAKPRRVSQSIHGGRIDISDALESALGSIKTSLPYNGTAQTQFIDVMYENEALVLGVDYTVAYTGNINVGTATVKLSGIGTYSGTASKTFKITPLNITSVSGIGDRVYTGKAVTFNPLVKSGNRTLVKDKDYTLVYSNNKNVGKATVIVVGKGNYTGKISKSFLIRPKKITGIKLVSATASSVTVKWDKTPSATGYAVLRSDSKNGKYYVVRYIKGINTVSFKDTGRAANKSYFYKVVGYVTVSGKNYTGEDSAVLSVKTATKAPKISLQKNFKKKKVTAKWKAVSGASGYEVYMSTSKKKGFKKIYTGGRKSYTKSKLKRGKTYYFKARTYRYVNGVKVYSSYSSVKSIKMKK